MESQTTRKVYIDNLRLFTIINVVIMHLAVTYSGNGGWYYKDFKGLGTIAYVIFGLWQSFTQGYFMGFLFLISGYFVAASYDKKGGARFLKERFIRLGIPTLIYMLLIHPFIMYVLLAGQWERPAFVRYYSDYVFHFDFIGQSGPLWFAFALLIFNCVYALIRLLVKRRPFGPKKLPGFPSVLLLILLISILTFLVRLVQPVGTDVYNMQLCNFTQYIVLFIVGIKAGRYDWFSQLSLRSGKRWLIAATIPATVFWMVIMLAGGALDDKLELYMGAVTWQSAAYALWESFVSVAMAIGLITLFREKYNYQTGVVKALSDSSFTVYMFHAPMIILISLVLSHLQVSPVVKFFIALFTGLPLCFIVSHFVIRRIPFLKKVL